MSLQPITSLTDLIDSARAFFIDVYGVLYNGETYYPPALRVCEQLMRAGRQVIVLSNATTVGSHFQEKHARLGFLKGVHYTDVVTSGDVLKEKLEKQHFLDDVTGAPTGLYTVIGRENDRLFATVLDRQTTDMDKAAAVYFGSLQKDGHFFETLDPYLPSAQRALQKGLPAICANPDYFAFIGDRKHVGQGFLARWYEEQGGTVYWIGKPYPEIYDYALRQTGISDPTRAVMVGDTIRTDILGGQTAGLQTVLITGTGITADLIAAGKELMQIADAEGAVPDYLLERLS